MHWLEVRHNWIPLRLYVHARCCIFQCTAANMQAPPSPKASSTSNLQDVPFLGLGMETSGCNFTEPHELINGHTVLGDDWIQIFLQHRKSKSSFIEISDCAGSKGWFCRSSKIRGANVPAKLHDQRSSQAVPYNG